MNAPRILPRFEVEELEGEVEEGRYIKTENGLERSTVMVPAGYMVYFPFGHSIRVGTRKVLERLGFHRIPGKVDTVEGEEIEPDSDGPTSLKQIVQRSTQQSRGRARQVEG